MTTTSPPAIPPELSRQETLRALQSQLGKVSFPTRSQAVLQGSILESLLPKGRLPEEALIELLASSAGAGASVP